MAGVIGIAQTAEVAAAVGAVKTIIQIVAASNHKVLVKRFGVFFDGVSGTAEPVQVRVVRQSTAGTMSALTPVKISNDSETLQTTAQHTATAEPTIGDILDCFEVHPQTGIDIILPQDQYIQVPGGGRLGLEINAPAAVNCRAKFIFEE